MTKEIKRVLGNILEVSQRMIIRELPRISAAIGKINDWINGIDYRKVRSMDDNDRQVYDVDKVKELEGEISKINKEA